MEKSNQLTVYKNLHEEFLDYERPRISEQGFETIKKTSRRVLLWFEKENIPLGEATIHDILRYKRYISALTRADGQTIATGTMHNFLKAGKRVFKYLTFTNRRKTNPFEEITYPRLPDHISRNILTEEQMGDVLRQLSDFSKEPSRKQRLTAYRSHVLAELLYATGLRIMEAYALTPADVDIRRRLVTVQKGKGGKKRYAFLTSYAAEVLDCYLKTGREKTAPLSSGRFAHTLFCSSRLTLEASLNKYLKKVCTELAVPIITCHGFRHSLGTHLLRAGCDMRYIQIILGHEKLSSTQIYTRINKDDLKRSIDDFHPRQRHRTEAAKK